MVYLRTWYIMGMESTLKGMRESNRRVKLDSSPKYNVHAYAPATCSQQEELFNRLHVKTQEEVTDLLCEKKCTADEIAVTYVIPVVLKTIISSDEKTKRAFQRECDVLAKLKTLDACINVQQVLYMDHSSLITRRCSLGDMYTFMHSGRKSSLQQAVNIFQGIVAGLQHVQRNGITHGDIKPENLFMDLQEDDQIIAKLGDFEFATLNNEPGNDGGTKGYESPARLKFFSDGHRLIYKPDMTYSPQSADIFATGLTMAYFLTDVHPLVRVCPLCKATHIGPCVTCTPSGETVSQKGKRLPISDNNVQLYSAYRNTGKIWGNVEKKYLTGFSEYDHLRFQQIMLVLHHIIREVTKANDCARISIDTLKHLLDDLFAMFPSVKTSNQPM